MIRSSSAFGLLVVVTLTGCASYEVKAPCRRLPETAVAYGDPCGEMRSVNQRFEEIELGELPTSVGQPSVESGE